MTKTYRFRSWSVCALALLFSLTGARLTADAQFRLAATLGAGLSDRPSYSEIGRKLSDSANVFQGATIEIITQRMVGFGIRGQVRFTELDESESPGGIPAWWLDWNGQAFFSAHLLGGGSLIDPFVEIGYGNVGRANIANGRSGVWSQDESGLWSYRWNEEYQEGVSNLSLFPVAAAGVALDLTGLLIGVRVAYRPVVHAIPATSIANYPLARFHVEIVGGMALGGHR